MAGTKSPHQLLLIKQLYDDACGLTSRGDTLSLAKAIILLDLSVEQMLNSIIMDFVSAKSPKLKPGRKDQGWGELWGLADEAMQQRGHAPLINYTQLLTLHEVRNLAQHNGSIPTRSEIERYIEPAEEMLCGAFASAYGQDFRSFRLWDLVPNESLRRLLKESEIAFEKGHPDICIAGCNLAHKLIISAIRQHTKLRRFRIPSPFTRSSSGSTSFPPGLPAEAVRQLRSAARQVDDAIRTGVSKFRREILEEIDYLEDEVVTIGVGMPLMDTRQFVKVGQEVIPGPFYGDGTFDIFRHGAITNDEELQRGARFMLNYLSRLLRLVDESYPDVLCEIELKTPLSAQGFWRSVDETAQ